MNIKTSSTIYAILAALLYALSIPLSKLFLGHVSSVAMAAFLYLGAETGILALSKVKDLLGKGHKQERLTKKELPYVIAMVVLDIAAPIFLMMGISRTNPANVSLLGNFEIVATSIIALVVFKEIISKRLWIAILLVTIASAILSFENISAFTFNVGSLLILASGVCWGIENNCTRMISHKSSHEIVIIKGIFSGLGSLIIALILKVPLPAIHWILLVMMLGFVSYGLSIDLYIRAQKHLGAAKTSAYYAVAPFIGVALSFVIIGEPLYVQFYIALAVMIVSTILMVKDTISLQHTHEHSHTYEGEHAHGELLHSHAYTLTHTHPHVHLDDAESHAHEHSETMPDHSH